MKITKTAALTIGMILLAAVAVRVTAQHVSSEVKDSYFDPDTDKLALLPPNLVVVRPTHFPDKPAKVRTIDDSERPSAGWTLGRNVSLKDVIGAAWDCNPSRVVLPSDAPKGGYDFLATTHTDTQQRLQEAVRKNLGYVVHEKTQNTKVWILKVADQSLPGLTVSSANEKSDVSVRDEQLLFTHQPLNRILGGLSQGLGQPVVDQTGLDQFYNFSVPWNPEIQQRMQDGAFDLEGVKKVLASMGLRLESGTQPLDMYIVEQAH